MTTFGELNTGDMFRYVSNGNGAGAVFRKSSPRDAVQQREDGTGDLLTVDGTVKTRPRTQVVRLAEPETMTNGEKAAKLLREAATKVAEALALLDLRERDCSECGLRHYTNRVHAKVNRQFSGTPIQLRERATELTEQVAEQSNSKQTAQSAKEQ